MLFKNNIPKFSFHLWMTSNRENKTLLWILIPVIAVQFIIFKKLYPFPNFMPPDSNSYIEAAFNNQFINFWAIGYSKFLRLFSSFTNSHLALVWFQYLLLEFSLLYFLFSLKYLLTPPKWVFRTILGISVINPLLCHISNFVGSDNLFISFSLIWLTQLSWILNKPKLSLLFWHALILCFVFMIRYNALYYPIISIATILISKATVKLKYIGIGSILILLGAFIGKTEYTYYEETGSAQFSAFGGWQLAANALYGYAHTSKESASLVPPKFQKLQTLVNHDMDSLKQIFFFFRPDYKIGIYYLWDASSPLKEYMSNQSGNATSETYFKQWAAIAPLYKSYGEYLIRNHPVPFIRRFIWPNLLNYCIPPAGFLGSYNINRNYVDSMTVRWFRWKSNIVHPYFKNTQIRIADVFSKLSAIINLLYIISFIYFLILLWPLKSSSIKIQISSIIFVTWLFNLLFSVFSAPIELRYQLFNIIVTLVFMWLQIAYIVEASLKGASNHQTDFNTHNDLSNKRIIQSI